MRRAPAVSVLMPVYRPNPEFFCDAVRSVLAQTVQDFELIIVEDPSDRPARLPAELSDTRIRHIVNHERTSHVAQINRALALARADLVAHLDADDVCESHRLHVQVEYMRSHSDVGVLGSHISVIDATGRHRGFRQYPVEHRAIVATMPRLNALAHSTVVYRKSLVLEAGGYSELVYPAIDYELWSRLALRGVRFANYPEPLVRYRLHVEGIKRIYLRETIRASREVKRTYWLTRMRPRDRLRFWAEAVLLKVPPGVVLLLFDLFQLRWPLRVRRG